MAGTGPTPNPNSRRQTTGSTAGTWLDLPSAGCDVDVPDWPFAKTTVAELEMWQRYWGKPQAAAWHRLNLLDEVALYVRLFQKGVGGNVGAVVEARQWADRLGLTPGGLLKNRWRIRDIEVGKPAVGATAPAKRTLKVVDG